MPETSLLRVSHTATNLTDTLGPGTRAVVWVQGCTIHCEGCIVPESWGTQVGTWVSPEDLAQRLLGGSDNDLTVSGGEPTEQPAAVADLLRAAKRMGRTTWVYTGRRLDDLLAENDQAIVTMLQFVDVLVDGPYERQVAGGAGYRGSRNQRLIRLTDAIPEEATNGGIPGKIGLVPDEGGGFSLVGTPEPGAVTALVAALAERGIELSPEIWR